MPTLMTPALIPERLYIPAFWRCDVVSMRGMQMDSMRLRIAAFYGVSHTGLKRRNNVSDRAFPSHSGADSQIGERPFGDAAARPAQPRLRSGSPGTVNKG